MTKLNNVLLDCFGVNYDEKDDMFSEHLVLLSSISCLNQSINNILEIGTYKARTTLILSKLFEEANILSIDLPATSSDFESTYHREGKVQDFVENRNKNLANKIRAAERNNVREDDIDLIFQKHANERRKFLAKSEKINEKIIDKPLPNETPKSIFIDFSQTILDLSPFIFLFIIIVFLYYSSNNKKGKRK